jgi:putative hydrolase of the HAD superfamily
VAISSHQVGAAKPDPAIYEEALERLDVPPDAIMFFDDVHANVVAASALGMRAFQVEGVGGLRQRLAAEGLLDSSRRTG